MSGQGSPEQIKKAQDNFGSAFDLASGNPNMKARVRIAQAEITSDNDEARQYLSEALDFSRKMEEHDSYLEATILRAQGDLENSLLNRDGRSRITAMRPRRTGKEMTAPDHGERFYSGGFTPGRGNLKIGRVKRRCCLA